MEPLVNVIINHLTNELDNICLLVEGSLLSGLQRGTQVSNN